MTIEEMERIRDASSWGTMTYALWNEAIKKQLAADTPPPEDTSHEG